MNIGNGTQNNGNVIGDRSTIRQSKLFRMYESGNEVKALLGQNSLRWDVTKKQGAYEGSVHDSNGNIGGYGYYKQNIATNDNIQLCSDTPSTTFYNSRTRRDRRLAEETEFCRYSTTNRQSFVIN